MRKMPPPFHTLDTDPDTTILMRELLEIQEHPVVHERWRWDGITGESLIFSLADVANVNDAELIAWSHSSGMVSVNEKPQVKRSESGFVFLSFGYRQ